MDVLSSLLGGQKQKFVYASETFCLIASALKKKSDIVLSDLEAFQMTPFKNNSNLDNPILQKLKHSKSVIYIASPLSRFIYRASLDAKMKANGQQVLISLIKDRFNVDLQTNQIAVLDSSNGQEIKNANSELPDNICFVGAQKQEMDEIQKSLMDVNCPFKKIFLSPLTTAKGLFSYLQITTQTQPVLFIDFSLESSFAFVLHENQIKAAYPPTYGLKNLITLTRKICSLPDEVSTYKHLTKSIIEDEQAMETVTQRMRTDIKSNIDFFEIQTGTPISSFYINGLPASMEWLVDHIGQNLEISPLKIDLETWFKANKVSFKNKKEKELVTLPQWTGMLCAIFNYFK